MLTNMIGNVAAKWVGGKLDGYKTKIGIVCGIIFLLLNAVQLIFPDLVIVKPEQPQDWESIINGIVEAVKLLSGGGAVVMTPAGIVHKAYKAGLNTPVPEQPQVKQEKQKEIEPGPPSGAGFGPLK